MDEWWQKHRFEKIHMFVGGIATYQPTNMNKVHGSVPLYRHSNLSFDRSRGLGLVQTARKRREGGGEGG
jgi:hypothetical protein